MRIYLIEEIGIKLCCEPFFLRWIIRAMLHRCSERGTDKTETAFNSSRKYTSRVFWRKSKERDIQTSRQLDCVQLFILGRGIELISIDSILIRSQNSVTLQ